MRHSTGGCLLVLFLAGLSTGVTETRALPAPLDQEEYLDAEDWFRAGVAFNNAGKYREASEAFARSIAVDPENPVAWLNLGTAQALAADYAEAVASLRKAVRLDPTLAIGYANLGEIYLRTGRFGEALEVYSALIALLPDDPAAHYKRGLAYLYLADTAKAQAEYLRLKTLDPELAGKLLQSINQGVTDK